MSLKVREATTKFQMIEWVGEKKSEFSLMTSEHILDALSSSNPGETATQTFDCILGIARTL